MESLEKIIRQKVIGYPYKQCQAIGRMDIPVYPGSFSAAELELIFTDTAEFKRQLEKKIEAVEGIFPSTDFLVNGIITLSIDGRGSSWRWSQD